MIDQTIHRLENALEQTRRHLRVSELAASLQENEAFKQLQAQLTIAMERHRLNLLDYRDRDGARSDMPAFGQGFARGALSVLELLNAKTAVTLVDKHRSAISKIEHELQNLRQGLVPEAQP